MATLAPSFRDFLPAWVAVQPWYRGSGLPSLALAGTYRLEDPAGEVGIETHLVRDGTTTYQVPMTYRGAPLAAAGDHAGTGTPTLIVVAEHSELGTRWIYDAEGDPVWRGAITRLVRDGRTVESRADDGDVIIAVTGHPLNTAGLAGSPAIELRRVLAPGEPAGGPPAGAAGLVMGTWRAGCFRAPGTETVTGCLAVLRVWPCSAPDC
ncbi:MAG: maltokinase N-terminal cap-like domain-containing protein [Trebonia sp.]